MKFTKLMGVRWVGLVDPLPNKRELARKMGADTTFAPDEVDFPKESFDVIVDAVGSEKIVNAAIPMIRLGGTIGVYGVISQPTLLVEKGKGPYNFNLIIHQWPTRWRERAAMGPLCDWIKAGKLSAAEFVTHRFKIAELDKALAAVKAGAALKVLMSW
ncbi:MAG: zinc-binding dehydrogenase [Lentisphaeria bacterium]|nr:zinc-binding dehydrogenase [Lentisphaeria bacterium]